MNSISALWNSSNLILWKSAEERYWNSGLIKKQNYDLEKEMDELTIEQVESLDTRGWYEFLCQKYFRWKFTVIPQYIGNRKHLEKYARDGKIDVLYNIKERILAHNHSDIGTGLRIADEIPGLSVKGASGLLALMYPHLYATVDVFLVKSLQTITDLREAHVIKQIDPNKIRVEDAVFLIGIMASKAAENNRLFGTTYWTPRRIDKVLWACR